MSLRPFACWDCGFESRRGHEWLSRVGVECCQVEVSATGRSFLQGNITECISLNMIGEPHTGGLSPPGPSNRKKRKSQIILPLDPINFSLRIVRKP